jgi:hypothetical protein
MNEPFDIIWSRIIEHQGDVFYTVSRLEFVYRVQGKVVKTNRTNYNISKSDFLKAHKMIPMTGPGAISNLVRGSSYIWAILHDSRIMT